MLAVSRALPFGLDPVQDATPERLAVQLKSIVAI
jgi:hypothetical protein